MIKSNDELFMKRAIELSASAVAHGNEPFGAVLVKDGEIVFENENQIYTMHDPTFHGRGSLISETTLCTPAASLVSCVAERWYG